MNRVLFFDTPLANINALDSVDGCAGYLLGYETVILSNQTSAPTTLASDQAILAHALAVNPALAVYVALDLATLVLGTTVAAVQAAYGAALDGIALVNCAYNTGGTYTVDRARQIAAYNEILSANLHVIFVCANYSDIIESYADATYNASGATLPIAAGDAVLLQQSVSGSLAMAKDDYLYQQMEAAARRFNTNLTLGTLYQYVDATALSAATGPQLQLWYDISAFFRDDLFGIGIEGNYSTGSTYPVSVASWTSAYANPSNLRMTRLTNNAVQREDGATLTMTGNLTTASLAA